MAISEKELMELQIKQSNGIKLSKDERKILKDNSNEEKEKKKGMSLSERLKKSCGNEYAQNMAEDNLYETKDYIDSGSVMFNVLLSGYYDKGYPTGRIISLAGLSATGKSMMGIEAVKMAQLKGFTAICFDSEFVWNSKEELVSRNVDLEKFVYVPVDTIESLRSSILNILDELTEDDKVIILIDSLGNLTSESELSMAQENTGKGDVGRRAALVKSLMRTITLKCGLAQIPVIAIQHTYQTIGGMFPQTVVASGSGTLYNSSIIIEFIKSQDKDKDKKVVGAKIRAKNMKNRFSLEKAEVSFGISFTHGVLRYSGLCEWCEANKFFKVSGRGYEYQGQKIQKSDMTPDFWETLLAGELGKKLTEAFKYQSSTDGLIDDEDTTED